MEAAHVLDDQLARAKMQVVGVGEYDLGTGPADITRTESANHPVSAHRHECRSLHQSVRQSERTGASQTLGVMDLEFEHQSRIRSICRRWTRSWAAISLSWCRTLSGPRSLCSPTRSS